MKTVDKMKKELVRELENTKCKACGNVLEADPALYPEFVNLEFSITNIYCPACGKSLGWYGEDDYYIN